MKVLGIRSSVKHFRYCILELAGSDVKWLNKDEEHKWNVPKASTEKGQILNEVHKEVVRLINKFQPDRVALKIAETMRGNPSPDRVSVEAVIVLAAAQNHIATVEKRYRDLKTKKEGVEKLALQHVTQPAKHWDSEIADALVVALRELGQ